VIVRISGVGQYELGDDAVKQLDKLDDELVSALDSGNEASFHEVLHRTIEFVEQSGKPVPADTVVPSDVIVPPDDVTLDEARSFFTDEGLMQPLPA
jgi:hypothetical protein